MIMYSNQKNMMTKKVNKVICCKVSYHMDGNYESVNSFSDSV